MIAGEEVHLSPGAALRYAGLPQPELVAADAQSRMIPAALEAALAADPTRPTLVLLQAGDIHSGDSDPFAELIPIAHRYGAWVHVDGAIGLWQAASPSLRHLVAGVELADSWTTDAHKTLNAPYDCGLIIVRDERAHRAAMAMHGPHIDDFNDGLGQPFDFVPEMSRRARGVPVWAVLRSLGRRGVAELVDQMALRARELAVRIAALPGAVTCTRIAIRASLARCPSTCGADLPAQGTRDVLGSAARAVMPGVGAHVAPMAYARD
ncbi:pyridoxal phosphate-dependent decarboxylase family protein [Microbacterium marmarense]|uniref:Pyridoxal-dependent decarboxylase n=1 Tax=Microbacterium marmarense TaxID=3122051 RepID=A0ABU8LSC9_9MICO